uniref:RNase H type-1 domain-containing protein n=1 Tax=Triticum urartu TaxID=4572 RepID=A0A8R7U5T3_TRIUA
MVLRECLGKINFPSCRVLFSCRDALEAELCTCMEGISLAIQRSELPIFVEIYSVVAVNMVKDRDMDRFIFASLVNKIKHLMSLHTTSVFHIKHNQIVVSHYLAKFARTEGRTVVC